MLRSFRDGSIFGDSASSAPPVIGLHGWQRSHRDLLPIVGPVGGVSLDLPGFGASPLPTEVWGARDYAAAVAEVIEELGVRPIVVGHSFGGRVAVCLAAQRPDLVSGLVVTGAPLLRPTTGASSKSPLPFRIAKKLHGMGVISDERMEAQRQKHGSTDYRNSSGVLRSILVKLVNEDYADELARVECPVELVWGGKDTQAPVYNAHRADEMLATARLTLLDEVGHDTPAEVPDVLRAALARLLEPAEG